MMTEQRLILVRHGASEWNGSGRYQGHLPVPLSSLGLSQANALAEELRQYKPERIVSSDLQRAKQTAEVLAKHFMLETQFDIRLRELNCGNWAGLTEREIEELEPQAVVELRAGRDIPRGGSETMADIMTRIRAALTEYVQGNFFSTLIIVSHAYAVRAIMRILLDQRLCSIQLPHLGSYTLLSRKTGNQWLLEQYSVVPSHNLALSSNVQWLPTL